MGETRDRLLLAGFRLSERAGIAMIVVFDHCEPTSR
jgi:hypothetical protein